MRLRNRIVIGMFTLFVAAGIGVAVAGVPRSITLDPIIDESSVATTSTITTTARPVITVPNPGSTGGSTTTQVTTTTINRDWLIEILNAGAGLGGAGRVADSLDLSVVAQIRLADAPNPEERSLIIHRPEATGLMELLVNANPILDLLERTAVDEWPPWADPSAVIVILVTADWPLDPA